MSSSRPASTRRAWSLRLRLLVGQIVVLAVVCVGITAATELALLHHLVAQLDGQLAGRLLPLGTDVPRTERPGWRHELALLSEAGPRSAVPRRAGPAGGHGGRGGQPRQDGRRRLPDQRRYPGRIDPHRPNPTGADRRQPHAGDPEPRRPGSIPRRRRPEPERGRRHRHRPVDVQRRRHHDPDAGHLRDRHRDRAGCRDDRRRRHHQAGAGAAASRRANRKRGRRPTVGPRRGRTAGAGARIRRKPLHRGGPTRVGTQPDARPHRGRAVGAAGQRDPGPPVRRRRQSRTAHAACRDPRLHRTRPNAWATTARRWRTR